jgi:hypothetical protein
VWVFEDTASAPPTAELLAERRDALRAADTALVSLYTGRPEDWSTKVLPMLRAADANFICAVANPPQKPTLGLWLDQNPKSPSEGIYVLLQDRRVLVRAGPKEIAVREILVALSSPRSAASRPDGLAPSQWARVRIIDLSTGSVLASAEAQAAEPAILAEQLAARLATATQPPSPIAVLPLRQTGGNQSDGMRLADDLGKRLTAAGWPDVVPVSQACEVLSAANQSPLLAEFDPASLGVQTRWKSVLTGTVRILPASDAP